VRAIEVTLNSPGALASIEEIAGAMDDDSAGAGTKMPSTGVGLRCWPGPDSSFRPPTSTPHDQALRQKGSSVHGYRDLKAYEYGGDIIVLSLGRPTYFKDIAAASHPAHAHGVAFLLDNIMVSPIQAARW
jgi:2-dehydro-3-deoxyphosphogluconate aldolase/(4S)-4-hydroxy-2-oxoglutarate aldolase